jgi:hypothetical protein
VFPGVEMGILRISLLSIDLSFKTPKPTRVEQKSE